MKLDFTPDMLTHTANMKIKIADKFENEIHKCDRVDIYNITLLDFVLATLGGQTKLKPSQLENAYYEYMETYGETKQ